MSVNSGLFKLNLNDLLKGLVMAVLTALFAYGQTALSGGAVDWGQMLNYAVASGIAYLAKNLATDSDGNTHLGVYTIKA